MAVQFKVEIINNEVIKPSSPSPHHPRLLNLSILDQLAPTVYVPLLLFYAKDVGASQTEKSLRLKTSLADTLNKFYPLAGRAKGNYSIDCNDEGIAFFEALIDWDLSDFLKEPEGDALTNMLPIESQSLEDYDGVLFFSIAQIEEEDKKTMELHDMVQLSREAIYEFSTNGVKRFQGENVFSRICEAHGSSRKLDTSEDVESYVCTSWSRFEFYNANFGWGQSAWISITTFALLNSFVLLDAKDGEGIEAWVTLSKETMTSFEHQEELFHFVT